MKFLLGRSLSHSAPAINYVCNDVKVECLFAFCMKAHKLFGYVACNLQACLNKNTNSSDKCDDYVRKLYKYC